MYHVTTAGRGKRDIIPTVQKLKILGKTNVSAKANKQTFPKMPSRAVGVQGWVLGRNREGHSGRGSTVSTERALSRHSQAGQRQRSGAAQAGS